jgi:hypothetical protein
MAWFERVQQQAIVIDPNLSPMDYLLARLRDPTTQEHVRDRIAIALLPFTVPKLQATATVQLGLDFAARLERAMLRSGKVRLVASNSDNPTPVFKRRF